MITCISAETFRPVARMFARKLDMSTDAVISLQTVLKNIQRIRSDEDLDVLDTVIETQQLLQQVSMGSLYYDMLSALTSHGC